MKNNVLQTGKDQWQVVYNDHVLPSIWLSKGGALAALNNLEVAKSSDPPERRTGLLDPTVKQLMENQLDVTAPPSPIEVKVDRHHNVLWINVGPVCLLRICRWKELVVDDNGKEHEEPTI